MSRPVKVAFLADTSDLRADLKKAEGAMESAAQEARTAGQKIDTAFDSTAEHADNVASKGSQAAGALSGLGDLIGGKFGAAMQVGGVAMQGFADAGDLLNVVTESAIFRKLKDIAVTTAHKVATVAATVATKAQTIAMRALNAVMKANPLGLVITAITLLVAGLVLAYKRSETFRKIVDKAWAMIKKATGAVFDWIRDKIKTAFDVVAKIFMNFTGPGLLIKHWDTIKAKTNSLVDFFKNLPGRITNAVKGMWNGIKDGFVSVINTIIGWWNGLEFSIPAVKVAGKTIVPGFTFGTPNIGYIGGGGGSSSRPIAPSNGRYSPGGNSISVTVNVPPTANPVDTGREIQRVLDTYYRSGGRRALA